MTILKLADGSQFNLTTAGFSFADSDKRTIGLELLTNKTLDDVITDFSDGSKTSKITISLDDGVDGPTYEGYTELANSYSVKKDVQGYSNKISIKLSIPETVIDNEELQAAISYTVANIPDQQALDCISIFPEWESYIGKSMPEGIRTQYEGKLYKSRQEIPTVLANQAPGIETAALYVVIDQEHVGTLEDPIPYDQMMEVFAGKYYLEDGIIYICNRDSGQPLYATCASLAGDSRSYFSVVE